MIRKNILKIILVVGDIFLFYTSLFVALALRYGGFSPFIREETKIIFYQFSLFVPLWLLFLYIFDFYEFTNTKGTLQFLRNIAGFICFALVSTVIYFYFVPETGIAPKTILILDVILFVVFLCGLRFLLRALPLGGLAGREKEYFYVSLDAVDEDLFREYIEQRGKFDEVLERIFDIFFGFVGFALLIVAFLCIAPFIKLTSSGPIFYTQKRVGKNGSIFTLYKFRTMVQEAEKDGPRWAEEKDQRVTSIGRILRRTHLDELPQAINILKGELSLVGPRPERPEFTSMLEKQIPHYQLRHLVKPGIFGWAQLHFPYGDSIEDAREKLKYDLYYIKNRSIIFDILIVLKSLKIILFAKGQ